MRSLLHLQKTPQFLLKFALTIPKNNMRYLLHLQKTPQLFFEVEIHFFHIF